MKFALELFIFTWRNLWRTKLHTIFAIAGVLIGSGAIMTMVSLGAGLQTSVTGLFTDTMDLQVLQVLPGYEIDEANPANASLSLNAENPTYPLNKEIIEKIKKIDGVAALTPTVDIHGGYIRVKGSNHNVMATGVDFSVIRDMGYKLEDGSKILRKPKGILLGNKVKEGLGEAGDSVDRANIQFVISKFDDEGKESKKKYKLSSMGIMGEKSAMEDYSLFIPIEMAEEMLKWQGNKRNFEKEGYDSLDVRVVSPEYTDRVTQELKDMNLLVFSPKELIGVIDMLFTIIKIILGAIGGIALLVAGLGIANTMIMSIYERTKEIGIMKVVGASLGDIRNMFILEAGIIGLLGGLGGVISGWILGRIIDLGAKLYIQAHGLESLTLVTAPPGLVLFVLIFSVGVGMISGLYPALKAMKLSPLSAIRQE